MTEVFKWPYLGLSDLKVAENFVLRRHLSLCGEDELCRGVRKRALSERTIVTYQAGGAYLVWVDESKALSAVGSTLRLRAAMTA